jgi:hypothetical protein
VIWEPFVLALVLGLIVSAGLYFAYLWPSVEPIEPDDLERPDGPVTTSADLERAPPDDPAAPVEATT